MTGTRTAVVVVTYNRCAEVVTTLRELAAMPERPQWSSSTTHLPTARPSSCGREHPDATVVPLGSPRGSSARNVGVESVDAPYVAFADDDSWWAPGALATAADLFDRHPFLGLLTATVLVGPEERVDRISEEMADSRLAPAPDLPGVPVLGFLACAAIVRPAAFRQVGGFHELAGFGGEETLLAMDLAARGWGLSFVDEVVAVHHPSPVRSPEARAASEVGNTLLRSWLRLPLAAASAPRERGWPRRATRPPAVGPYGGWCAPCRAWSATGGWPLLCPRRPRRPGSHRTSRFPEFHGG